MKIGIIGLGKMGEALASGIMKSSHGKDYSIQATTHSQKSAEEAASRLKIKCHNDNKKLAADSDIVILCVKPHQAEAALKEISKEWKSGQLLISICAALTTEQLSKFLGKNSPIIRAMPNTPCLVGEGMTVLTAGEHSNESHLKKAEAIFKTVGETATITEDLMDGATGLSGCGPAYVYLMIEALSEAGVKVGLPRKTSTLLAAQTLMGASKMVIEGGQHPAALKDEVTTPAGCTIDGLMALEEGALRVTLIKAVLAATRRSQKMGEKI
ncbi:pyrroline-5-carboxylate reductase [bacterium]|nr:pyrroline-5-carboxylate reductase [bacterium]